jgi:hypothetical protein
MLSLGSSWLLFAETPRRPTSSGLANAADDDDVEGAEPRALFDKVLRRDEDDNVRCCCDMLYRLESVRRGIWQWKGVVVGRCCHF